MNTIPCYYNLIKDKPYTIELIVTSNCNQKCAGCDHMGPLNYNYMLTPEDALKQVQLFTAVFPKLEEIILLGGEPTLNKNLFLICKILQDNYPQVTQKIVTNGTQPNDYYESFFSLDQVIFAVSPYLDDNKPRVAVQNKKFYLSTRFLFTKTYINLFGPSSKDSQQVNYDKCNLSIFGITLFDYKIFACPKAYGQYIMSLSYPDLHLNNSSFIDLTGKEFNKESLTQIMTGPTDACAMCASNSDVIFHQPVPSGVDPLFDYTTTKLSLFSQNYPLFYQYYNTPKFYEKLITKNEMDLVDLNFNAINSKNRIFRFLHSKIDIIIPYYKVDTKTVNQLYDNLVNQTMIKDCCIYFISDNSPDDEKIFAQFDSEQAKIKNLHCVFLRSSERRGAGVARNIALDDHYGETCLFLDVDDVLSNNDTLEKLYNIYSKSNVDIVQSYMSDPVHPEKKPRALLFNSAFLKNNNLRYGEIFAYEDEIFYRFCDFVSHKARTLEETSYNYLRRNNMKKINRDTDYPMFLYSLLSAYWQIIYNIKPNSVNEYVNTYGTLNHLKEYFYSEKRPLYIFSRIIYQLINIRYSLGKPDISITKNEIDQAKKILNSLRPFEIGEKFRQDILNHIKEAELNEFKQK